MGRSFEQIQKIIIVSAFTLGLLISVGGVSYKYLLAKEHPAVTAQNSSDIATTSISDNLYGKLQLRQPISIAVLGDSRLVPKEQQKLVNKLATEFSCKVSLFSLAGLDDSSWSTLMTLNNFISTKREEPDLILLYPNVTDQPETGTEQSLAIYEAILQTAGKAFPRAEVILVQGADLPEVMQDLTKHYNLPLVRAESGLDLINLLKRRSEAGITENKIDDVKPISDLEKYLTWQRIYEASLTHLMDKPKVKGDLPVLVGSQNGAYVESSFTGSAVGVLVKCVPDGGMARVYVDNNRYDLIDTYAPEPVMRYFLVADDLAPVEHRVRLYVLGQGKYPSSGTRVVWYGFDATGSLGNNGAAAQ